MAELQGGRKRLRGERQAAARENSRRELHTTAGELARDVAGVDIGHRSEEVDVTQRIDFDVRLETAVLAVSDVRMHGPAGRSERGADAVVISQIESADVELDAVSQGAAPTEIGVQR